MVRQFASGLFLGAALLAATNAAWAHAMLEHAEPRAGSILQASPASVTLWYSEELERAFSRVTVTDEAGCDQTASASVASGEEMRVALKPLRPGTYRVTWHALSVDTHRTQGAFSFTVAP